MKEYFGRFSVRKIILAIADCFLIAVSALITNFILTLFDRQLSVSNIVISIVCSGICCLLTLTIFGAYKIMWRYFNKKDFFTCIKGVTFGIIISCIITYVIKGSVPINYAFIHAGVSLTAICSFRYMFRTTFITLSHNNEVNNMTKRTLIVGGGRACEIILKEIKYAEEEHRSYSNTYNPICIVDDSASKIGKSINGIPIVGTTADISKFVDQFDIEQIIFAIPSCLDEERKRILDTCSAAKVPIKIVPFIGHLIFENDQVELMKQIRDIKVEDLLGRDPIKFDNEDIKNFINNKVCMVTGGGGSIGSELVRQIAKYSPKQIIIVDIYENSAYEIQQELTMDYGDSLNFVTLIASVRDYFRMNQIFERYKPQIVFHAAAHKHVPLMEVSPMEAIKNNVVGTFNVASIAGFHKVEKFVMISTDKAVNPTNVMGASKRCCEMIIQYFSQQQDSATDYVTTRFGNVLGSNGSVIPLFKKQIEQGKPVTVTHPDIIRYFMTIPEAVSLVMEAAAIAHGGEIFVLDMGKPVKIVTLAENLIRMYGKIPYKDVEIKFTGLRPGEKIKEELLMNEEGLKKTPNKLIFIGNQIEIDAEKFIVDLYKLKDAAKENNEQIAVMALHEIVPTFTTPEEFNSTELAKGKNNSSFEPALSKL
ncbi:MAG TPA: nucleoside-diphosphate sugar epimerase/dehydratase [Ruminococcus sp.]